MTIETESDDRKSAVSPFLPLLFASGAALLLGLAVWVYWPALAGPFILDDAPNLGLLREAGGHFSWASLQLYLASGWTGPTGRPITLLSFFLNAQDWPTDPWPFKVTNLALHMANGLLLLALGFRMARQLTDRNAALWVALAAMGLWLLHPIHVSTVMYVSQRMVELAVLFTLLGMLGYLAGRSLLQRRPVSGYGVMTVSVVAGTVLATYSKEIGVLLPVYILVLELTVLAAQPPRAPLWWLAKWAIVYLPCLMLAGYFMLHADSISDGYIARPFSLAQRLLTEPRVLSDYLGALFMPWTCQATLFHDDYAFSTGWLTPVTTLPAVVAVFALTVAALLLRRRAPVASLAILWFFGGHLLESSFLALELYFEHRNYLPTFGPLFALAYYGVRWRPRFAWVAPAALVLFMGAAALQTRAHAQEWHSEGRLAQHWYELKPNSVWAHQRLSNFWLQLGFPDKAYAVLETGEARNPDKLDIELLKMRMACKQRRVQPAQIAELRRNAADSASGRTVKSSLDELFGLVNNGRCASFDREAYTKVLRAMLENPHFSQAGFQARLLSLLARTRLGAGDFPAAVALAEQSMAIRTNLELATQVAYWHFHAGDMSGARVAIERARRLLLDHRGRLDIRYDARLKALEQRMSHAEQAQSRLRRRRPDE